MRMANLVPKQKRKKDSKDSVRKSFVVTEDQPGIPLPHEHDESPDSQSGGPHKIIRKAKQDVDQGIEDTDRRGSYGLGEGKGLKSQMKKR